MIAGECAYGRMHVAREYAAELAGRRVRRSGIGTLLLSSRTACSAEMRWLRTNDRVRLSQEPCECGALLMPTVKVLGRTDFIAKVRGERVNVALVAQRMEALGLNDFVLVASCDRQGRERLDLVVRMSALRGSTRSRIKRSLPHSVRVRGATRLTVPLRRSGKRLLLIDRRSDEGVR
jgi:phenylacetate-coenzyme A ligase PaaK-like adenylate-forming protein